MAAYRQSVSASLLFKFYLRVCSELQQHVAAGELSASDAACVPVTADALRSVLDDPKHGVVSVGQQSYDLPLSKAMAMGLVAVERAPAPADGLDVDVNRIVLATGAETGDDVGGSVGKAVMHASAKYQVTGEALYCDDIPVPSTCLEAALVCSTRAKARIVSVDVSAAMLIDGVVDVVLAKDVPG